MDKDDETVKEKTIRASKFFFGVRHIQFMMFFLAIAISYGMRTVLSVAIIAMTDRSPPYSGIITHPEWEGTDTILSSFFWGYMITQIGAGQLAERFGPKWFLALTVSLGALSNCLIPVIADHLAENGVMACRVILGLCQGFLYPSINNLLSKWTPENERLIVTNVLFNGANLGIAISMLLTGTLSGTKVGWPLAFYFYGGLSMVWVLAWCWIGTNSPEAHSSISAEELDYIQKNIKAESAFDRKLHGTPWLDIAKSFPMWAILVVHFGQYWGIFTLFTEIPTYLANVMDFDLSQNSLLSTLPYFVTWVFGFFVSALSNKLVVSKTMNVTNVRKLFQVSSCFLPALALIALAFIDKSQKTIAVFLLVVAVGTTVGSYCGYAINHIDLAPNYGGTLFGISNSLACIGSILGPLTVGFFGGDKKDPILWRKVFCLAAGVFIGTGVFYGIFGSGEVQYWNDKLSDVKGFFIENVAYLYQYVGSECRQYLSERISIWNVFNGGSCMTESEEEKKSKQDERCPEE